MENIIDRITKLLALYNFPNQKHGRLTTDGYSAGMKAGNQISLNRQVTPLSANKLLT